MTTHCKPVLYKAGHPLIYFTCMWKYKLFHPIPQGGLTSLTPERQTKVPPFGCQMSLSEIKNSFVFGSSPASKAAQKLPTGNNSESFIPQRKEGSASGWISLSYVLFYDILCTPEIWFAYISALIDLPKTNSNYICILMY